jgi:hypothetical protein
LNFRGEEAKEGNNKVMLRQKKYALLLPLFSTHITIYYVYLWSSHCVFHCHVCGIMLYFRPDAYVTRNKLYLLTYLIFFNLCSYSHFLYLLSFIYFCIHLPVLVRMSMLNLTRNLFNNFNFNALNKSSINISGIYINTFYQLSH